MRLAMSRKILDIDVNYTTIFTLCRFVRKLTFSTIVEQRTSPFGSWISLTLLSLRSSTHGELTGGNIISYLNSCIESTIY